MYLHNLFLAICCSKFGDIFDEEYFIDTLKNDVRIVKHLPEDVLQHFDNNISNIVNLRVKAWSSPSYYLKRVLPKLLAMGYAFVNFIFLTTVDNNSLSSPFT